MNIDPPPNCRVSNTASQRSSTGEIGQSNWRPTNRGATPINVPWRSQRKKRLQRGQIPRSDAALNVVSHRGHDRSHLELSIGCVELTAAIQICQLTTRITGRRELTLISKNACHRRSRACDGSSAFGVRSSGPIREVFPNERVVGPTSISVESIVSGSRTCQQSQSMLDRFSQPKHHIIFRDKSV